MFFVACFVCVIGPQQEQSSGECKTFNIYYFNNNQQSLPIRISTNVIIFSFLIRDQLAHATERVTKL